MVKIAVIGTGYVGLVSGACLADFGNRVICADIDSKKISLLKKGLIPIYEPGLEDVVNNNVKAERLIFTDELRGAIADSEVVFIAVGTPPLPDGSADLSQVEAVARQIGKVIEDYKVVVNKSTVPIGTARKVQSWLREELAIRGMSNIGFDVVSNPEFLREGSAVFDFMHPDRVVIGAETQKARDIMKAVYRALYLTETPYIETGLETAEMIKYAANSFLALKITFINEIANLCEKVGADVQDVAKAMGRDKRIGPKFLHPGPGYGGSCFPKDTKAIAWLARQAGSPLTLIEATIAANERQRELMLAKIEKGLSGEGGLAHKTLALLGLSFKPNTDDLRDSPALDLARGLLARGASLRLYDPIALQAVKSFFSGSAAKVYLANDEYDAITGAHALIIATEWNQFRNLDLTRIKGLLVAPYFFDLRNIYQRQAVEEKGLKYFGVGK